MPNKTLALFIDDVAAARLALEPLLKAGDPGRIVIVACAPKFTHHVGRFLSHANREQYRQQWGRELFVALQPLWSSAPRGTVETMVAKSPIEAVVQGLRDRGDNVVALDARRARLDHPRREGQPVPVQELAKKWLVPAFVSSGVGIAIVMAD